MDRLGPRRRLEQVLVVVAEIDQRRRQHLVEPAERGEDRQQLREPVVSVDEGEAPDELLDTGQRERRGERAAVRRAQHDEASAAGVALGVVHRRPGGGEVAADVAGDEAAHRVGDEVHRPAGTERPHLGLEAGRALRHVLAPVERERPHLPLGVELREQRQVRAAVDARRAHAGPRRRRQPVRHRQLEVFHPATDEAGDRDPDPLGVAPAVDAVEQRAHDPRQHEHLAAPLAAPVPRGGLQRPLHGGGADVLAQQRQLVLGQRQQLPAHRPDVTGVERVLQRIESRRCLFRHGDPPPQLGLQRTPALSGGRRIGGGPGTVARPPASHLARHPIEEETCRTVGSWRSQERSVLRSQQWP